MERIVYDDSRETQILQMIDIKDIEKDIGTLVRNGSSYIDALIHYSEKHNIELEALASAVKKNANLKAILQEEAESLHYLPKNQKAVDYDTS